jgi:NAD+ synthase
MAVGQPAWDPEAAARYLAQWIRTQLDARGGRSAVVGLSGGIDSAVVAALCAQAVPGQVYALLMPIHSPQEDLYDAQRVAQKLGIAWRVVDLSGVYDAMLASLGPQVQGHALASANLRPRLRMAALYAEAAVRQGLVVGTGNRDELELGYFTKYGDGGVDLLPLGSMDKMQVRDLARVLGLPQRILDRAPSAGLWEGQTDEGELGFSYEALDRWRRSGQGDEAMVRRVEELRQRSEHKRQLPPVAPWPPA